ncbi:hypothetical protein EVJ58_g9095 [Rhodofomes roseus]|uniref:Uncharacterized protein n=1 Tax=Rhodofomes roseus TaxID=34475 RepID=A0A4Y9XW80_9APHY|nr:hypothetical protein EVJ58_g9095 [Rhodofomes roseus]
MSGVHLGRPPVRTPRPLPRSVAVQATRVARPIHVLNEQRLTAQWGERLPGPRPSKLSPSEGSRQDDLDVALELVYALLLPILLRVQSAPPRAAQLTNEMGDVLQIQSDE